jgi:hypothetical protein
MHEMYRRRVALAFGMPEDTDSDVLAARVDEERERRAALTAKGDWRTPKCRWRRSRGDRHRPAERRAVYEPDRRAVVREHERRLPA